MLSIYQRSQVAKGPGRRISRLAVVGVLFASAAFGQGSPRSLDRLLDPIRQKHNLPALSAALVHDGKVVALGATGLRKIEAPGRVTVNDAWHLGSCTKAMTATVIARLVDEGKLSWDRTIGQTFPELKDKINAEWLPVTLDQLLTHRSGLPDDRNPDAKLFPQIRALSGPIAEQRRQLLQLVLAQPPAASPGTKMQYANAGYAVAGAMAEAVSGKTWEELMQERLFTPLGMSTAGFGAPGVAGNLSQPRGHFGWRAIEPSPQADNPAVLGPAGTVHASIGDWAKFVALHLAGARGTSDFLKPETFQKLHTPAAGQDYAYGWLVTEREWAGGRALTHAGSNNMWYAVVWVAPEKNFAVLVATNIAGDQAPAACDETVKTLVQDFLKQQPQP